MQSMFLTSRTFIAALTIVAIIISALWANSPDALSDAMKVEMVLLEQHPADINISVSHIDKHDHTAPSQSCNHGCHAASHLLGLFEPNIAEIAQPIANRIVASAPDQLLSNPFLQGPYRPPLTRPLV